MQAKKTPPQPILLVDDEVDILQSYQSALRHRGYNNLVLAEDSRRVPAIMSETAVSVVILDLAMPHLPGKVLLARIKDQYPQTPVLVVTGSNDVETAVECMKAGAFDYMLKPVEMDRLVSSVARALELCELHQELDSISKSMQSDDLDHPEAFEQIVTRNCTMRSIFKYMEAIAASPRAVLITGESGVGKELFARAMHTLSGRDGKFVSVNAAGLDDTVFSDTLFGHRKGAFTGADGPRRGLIEQAAGGTLFLDEIGDLEPNSQVKLLRLLQEGEYYPLGADVPAVSDARIIAATNADLGRKVETGAFRRDLLYRLNTHHISVPPLSKRLDDLPILTEHLAQKAAAALQRDASATHLPAGLVPLLSRYRFPGNVRELESLLFDAMSRFPQGTVPLSFFKDYLQRSGAELHEERTAPREPKDLLDFYEKIPTIREMEDFLIRRALDKTGNNQSAAARLLGISQSTLSRWVRDNETTGEA